MTTHSREFVMVERLRLRERAERTIEALIAMLDELDSDPDLEDADEDDDGTDREWSLGATEHIDQRVGWEHAALDGDLEHQVDDEPVDSDELEQDPAEFGIADADGIAEQCVGDSHFGSNIGAAL